MSLPLHGLSGAAAAVIARPAVGPAHPRLVLATTILASSLAFIDGSVVNVGLPAIGHALSAPAGALQWIINAYLLPLGALLLLGGAAGDRFGRRRLLIAGMVVFALASLACAVAPGLNVLLFGRFAQGVSAALVMPNSLALLGATFSGESKGRAIGVWAASGAAMGAFGPVLGGWLIDLGSWRAIFLINLPLAATAIALASRYVAPDRAQPDRTLDWLGGLLATVGLGVLTWALTIGAGRNGWTIMAGTMAFAAAVVLLLFVMLQRRLGDRAMMPLSLFTSRGFIGLTLLTLFLYGALGGLFVLIPYVLIKTAHYAAASAGAALLPLPFMLAVASPPMGALAGRIGPRLPLSIGPLLVAGGFLLALRFGPDANYWNEVLPAIVVVAIGMSGAVAPLTTAVLSVVDPAHTGSASGFNSAAARIGSLIATALLGSVLAASGAPLLTAFHAAAVVGAGLCIAAGACAYFLIGGGNETSLKVGVASPTPKSPRG